MTRTTRAPVMEVSTSAARHSRRRRALSSNGAASGDQTFLPDLAEDVQATAKPAPALRSGNGPGMAVLRRANRCSTGVSPVRTCKGKCIALKPPSSENQYIRAYFRYNRADGQHYFSLQGAPVQFSSGSPGPVPPTERRDNLRSRSGSKPAILP